MSNVVIDIAAQFTGAKAFKQAETSTQKLDRSVRNLGRSLGLTLSTAAVVAYGKAAVSAFAAEEKSVKALNIALANTGNAFATIQTEQFIKNLSRTANVIDDDLRPAFQTILTATGSLGKAQEGLALALDISAATGKDLGSVSLALAKGYSGQTTALNRLGVGLDKALLKSGNMAEIVDVLTEKFKGQAAAAAKGYSGQINAIAIASDDAKEIIGKGLLDAMRILGGKDGIQGATDSMVDFATAIADTIVGVTTLIREIKNIPGMSFLGKALSFSINNSPLALIQKYGASQRATPGQSPAQRAAIDKANAALQKEKNNLLKIDNQLTKDKLKLSADQKALEALKKIFDPEQAQLAAASAAATDVETKARIDALKAIKDNDTNQARLAVSALYASGALDGFGNALLEAIQKLSGINLKAYALYNTEQFTPAQQQLETLGIPQGYGNMIVPQSIAGAADFYTNPNYEQYRPGVATVNITIDPSLNGVLNITQNASASGVSPTVNRNESSYMA